MNGHPRIAMLARRRAAHAMTEEVSLVWFGVGRATLERIEAGEVEPGDEIAGRIDRYLAAAGGGLSSFGLPGPPLAHDGGPDAGAVKPRGPGVIKAKKK